jgi:16S rRNA (cytosine967-C5)-methyltransferase
MKPQRPHFAGPRHNARSLALQVLLDCREHNVFIQEALDRRLREAPLTPADRRLATTLAYGVLRRRGTLDALLRPFVTRQRHQVEPWLWDVLRLGAFQLALLTHVPAHAALYETVELAGGYGRPKAKGFLNGVLRSLNALLTPDAASGPAADAVPIDDGRYRQLARPVLPDPAVHRVEFIASAFALPAWLVGRWLERYPWEECLRLGFWFAAPAPVWLRCNTLRTDRERCLAAFREASVAAEPGDQPQAIRLVDPVPIRELPGYGEGWFAVQDESAMRVAPALRPEPGQRVLDLCAAPGGKTTHMAERMRDEGRIVACDIEDGRLETVVNLARRLGVTIIETCRLDAWSGGEPPAGPFDAALVDVPCSNTGVLGRRPEVRWRLRPGDLTELVRLQTRLLIQGVERVRPGGAVVYSTCSIEPQENGGVVRAVLRAFRDLTLEAEEEQVPGRPADGGFWARLRRRSYDG